VREKRRAHDIIVPMNGIAAPDHWNARQLAVRFHRSGVKGVGGCKPILRWRIIAAAGIGIAAVQHRTQMIAVDIIGRDTADIRLNDLAHFLLKRHRRQQFIDASLDRGVESECRRPRRPVGGIGLSGGHGIRNRRLGGRYRNRMGNGQRCKRREPKRHDSAARQVHFLSPFMSTFTDSRSTFTVGDRQMSSQPLRPVKLQGIGP
jgi:hypothetical protein